VHLNQRALKLYLCAKGYCLWVMEVRFLGIGFKLLVDFVLVFVKVEKKDVLFLYWMVVFWGSAIGFGIDRFDIVIDMSVVWVLAERVLVFDEGWVKGMLHEMFVLFDSFLDVFGGSLAWVREYFTRVIELQYGLLSGLYVAFATGVVMPV